MKNIDKKKVDCEDYFIQLLFCKNRLLLRREFRELYDVLFRRYSEEFKQVPKGIEGKLNVINANFIAKLFAKK